MSDLIRLVPVENVSQCPLSGCVQSDQVCTGASIGFHSLTIHESVN